MLALKASNGSPPPFERPPRGWKKVFCGLRFRELTLFAAGGGNFESHFSFGLFLYRRNLPVRARTDNVSETTRRERGRDSKRELIGLYTNPMDSIS